MFFDSPVSAAGFNFRAGQSNGVTPFGGVTATMQFSAYLGSALIETFQADVPPTFDATPQQFYGFSGVIFNRIVVSMIDPVLGPPCCGANLDNVSFNVTPVPIPAALPLLMSALGFFGFLGWRRKRLAAA